MRPRVFVVRVHVCGGGANAGAEVHGRVLRRCGSVEMMNELAKLKKKFSEYEPSRNLPVVEDCSGWRVEVAVARHGGT